MKNLLLNNPHSDPLIYLRGVNHEELHSLLQFIYLGEVELSKDRINYLLDIAKDLKLKQVTESFKKEILINKEYEPTNNVDDAQYESNSKSSTADEILCDKLSDKLLYSCKECKSGFKSRSGLFSHNRSKHEGIAYFCNQCEYKATHQYLLTAHKRNKHEGIK